jgi:hypothetical protein
MFKPIYDINSFDFHCSSSPFGELSGTAAGELSVLFRYYTIYHPRFHAAVFSVPTI